MNESPVAIVISGPSSAGKTSLAKALQESLLPEVWLAFSVDDIIYGLPESVLHRCNLEDNWEGVDGGAFYNGATGCLRALLEAGNRVIFDAVVGNEKSGKSIEMALSGFAVFTIELRCDLSTLEQRASHRGDRTIRETRRSFESSRTHAEPDCVLDSGEHTVEEMAALVVEAIHDARALRGGGKPI
ncbi:MAG: hypothetical protein CMO55_16840 [Verrucomicrobiales bacterium]|nr:hypothetical protein [Verrucomicrobiales bacterium]